MGIALVLSLITAALVYNFLRESVKKPLPSDLASVVVARVDIPPKTRITPEMVQVSQLPAEYIQTGAVRELPKVVGVVAREAIVNGEQVLERRLLMKGTQAGFTGVIPAGKRALTVAVTDVTGVAGLLKAGDSVDAIVTFDQQAVGAHVSRLLLQNLTVLAVRAQHLYFQGLFSALAGIAIARKLNLSLPEIHATFIAGLVHDVGVL